MKVDPDKFPAFPTFEHACTCQHHGVSARWARASRNRLDPISRRAVRAAERAQAGRSFTGASER